MATSGSDFNWQAFLIGVAVSLGIMIFVLLLVPRERNCCGSGPQLPAPSPGPGPTPLPSPLYLPDGNTLYRCSSNDGGGGVVMDGGGGVVMDDGKGNPLPDAPRVPAPGGVPFANDDRGYREFLCGNNDGGGGVVMDAGRRVVAAPIRSRLIDGIALACVKVGNEVAVIDLQDRYRVRFNYRGNPVRVLSDGKIDEQVAEVPWQEPGSDQEAQGDWLFCALHGTSDVALVDRNGVVIKSASPPPAP